MVELHGDHQNFIESHSGELSQQEILGEWRIRMLYLQQLHKV